MLNGGIKLIHNDPPDLDSTRKSNSASFKFVLFETLNADPQLKKSKSCLALMIAYSKFMSWPGRTCYLTNLTAEAITGMRQSTITTARGLLVEHGYLSQTLIKKNGAIIYEVNNPRELDMKDYIQIRTEHLKEQDAFRKADERKKSKCNQARALKIVIPLMEEGNDKWGDRVTKIDDNSLDRTCSVGFRNARNFSE